jgi:hypothetical protein
MKSMEGYPSSEKMMDAGKVYNKVVDSMLIKQVI